jgi:hypothetical protein
MKHLKLGAMWIFLAMTSAMLCRGIERADPHQPAVQLRDAVEVKEKRVLLSDLLPPDAPAALQKASAAIALCRAPQPGGERVLNSEQITSQLAGRRELLRQLEIPARIKIRNSGWPIAEARVRTAIARFMREQGLKHDLPDASRLEWLAAVSAEKAPTLQVQEAAWDNRQQSVQVRLRCSARTSCGSFLVHIVLPASLAAEWHNWLEPDSNSLRDEARLVAPATALAEKGKPATLILDDGSMRISLRVICLQPGALNQQIRVFDTRSRHVFHAEVVGAGLLHANL